MTDSAGHIGGILPESRSSVMFHTLLSPTLTAKIPPTAAQAGIGMMKNIRNLAFGNMVANAERQ
jgi:hypothetical protein